jgi:hypothetical protein
MSELVKFKISSVVAEFVRPGVTAEKKLAGIQTAPHMGPSDRLTMLFCLMKDTDGAVKSAAESACADVPVEAVRAYVKSAECHPSVLSVLAKLHHGKPDFVLALLDSTLLPLPARQFLERQQALTPPPVEPPPPAENVVDIGHDELAEEADYPEDGQVPSDDEMQEDEPVAIDEEGEEFLSKYKIAMIMGISEKIKMALSGDKEWRAILVKDPNKLISGSVIKNPRISDAEILNILKLGVQNDEIIRLICANKEWTKNYQIRKALINCPKTPLSNALRYLGTLTEKDLSGFAKSKNISSVLASSAKRLVLAKQKKR